MSILSRRPRHEPFPDPDPRLAVPRGLHEAFADIYEHSPWVAEKAYDLGIDDSLNDIEGLHQRMADILLSASREAQLALITPTRTSPARRRSVAN